LYGLVVIEELRITILEKGSNIKDNMEANGRAIKREVENKNNEIIRNNDDKNDRGVSMSMKIGLASLEINSKELK
jgi:hypothetical protein